MNTLDLTRHEAELECERDLDAAICDMPREEYNELAVEFLAETKLEGQYREWLRVNYPEKLQ